MINYYKINQYRNLGTLILGILNLLWNLAIVISVVILMIKYSVFVFAAIILIFPVLTIIFTSFLLYGLKSRRPVFLLVFFIWKVRNQFCFAHERFSDFSNYFHEKNRIQKKIKAYEQKNIFINKNTAYFIVNFVFFSK